MSLKQKLILLAIVVIMIAPIIVGGVVAASIGGVPSGLVELVFCSELLGLFSLLILASLFD